MSFEELIELQERDGFVTVSLAPETVAALPKRFGSSKS